RRSARSGPDAAVRGVLGARPRAPVTMQPSPRPPSAPPAHPVAPEISRGYGWLVLGGALVWAALVALVLIAFGSLLSSLVLAVAALGASLVELTQVTALLIWLLFMVVLVAAPLIRVGQGVAGVIRLITGEPARPTPPPAAHGRFGW